MRAHARRLKQLGCFTVCQSLLKTSWFVHVGKCLAISSSDELVFCLLVSRLVSHRMFVMV